MGSIPGSGRSPGEGNGNPLQCSCLGNTRDRGAWWAIVHGIAKSQTRLTLSFCILMSDMLFIAIHVPMAIYVLLARQVLRIALRHPRVSPIKHLQLSNVPILLQNDQKLFRQIEC